jgi:hypothetical protein
MQAVVLVVLWLASGAGSFIYWWTRQYDLTMNDVPLLVINALNGPFAFLVGWILHPSDKPPTVLIRKRGK